MDETSPNEKPAKDFNKIDLGQLQSFSFGTQWTQDKTSSGPSRSEGGRGPRREDRPRREDSGGGAPAGASRDRRGFRKPAGPTPRGDESSAGAGANGAGNGGEASTFSHPRREGGNDAPRGPRREGQGRGEFRGGGRFGGPREGGAPARDQGPYVSPFYDVTFYPEDTGFSALAKAIRTSCRTYELFEIARVVIGKNDRFVAVIQHKKPEAGALAAESAPRAKPAPFAIAVPDGTPFENEAAAIAYVLEKHLGQFFDAVEVEVEAPKGNFQVVNKCTITGELLGPPNYHRYNQTLQQHHAARIKLPLEVYRGKIESVRDPEAIAQWLEKMKKATRYTWKTAPAAPIASSSEKASTSEVAPAAESAPAAAEGEAADTAPTAEAPTSAPENTPEAAPAAPAFDTIEEAREYLLVRAKDKVVRTVETLRFHGKNLESMPQGELRRALEGALERQRRFPLDTANALRGRLRRESFTIFKKGSKGISYVCAVKRKFRVPGQVFADSIGALIVFIESHPMVKVSALPEKFLGIAPAPKPDEASTSGEAPDAVATAPTAEQQAGLHRLGGDLRWLISEGYVTEFIDGCLFASAPVVEARKKEIEGAEHDPENFPETPKVVEPKAEEQPKAEA